LSGRESKAGVTLAERVAATTGQISPRIEQDFIQEERMRVNGYMMLTTLVLSGLAGTVSGAEPESPAPPSKPAAENEALKMFVGNWTCQGTAMLGPGKTVKVKATAKVKSELGGFWQSYVYTEQKSKDYPMAITAMGTWGWDAQAKKFVRGEFQSGGGYTTGTSTGWTGDTMTWDLDVSNFMGKMSMKHVFTKKSDKEFVHQIEGKMPGSPGPAPLFEVTCKK
jgi:hypothetical protein